MLGNDIVTQEEFDAYNAEHVNAHGDIQTALNELKQLSEKTNKRIDNAITTASIIGVLIVIFFGCIVYF